MSTIVYLFSSNAVPPDGAETAELELLMGGMLPPFWLALFDAETCVVTPGTDDGFPLLVSDRMAALSRLQSREEHLLTVFGGQAAVILKEFSGKLATLQSPMLILESSQMGMLCDCSADQWREELRVMMSAFDSAPQERASLPQRLLGGPATSYNAGWRAYFRHFDSLKTKAKTGQMSECDLAGGSDDSDMPWELIEAP